jgi:hypothetical protein
MQQNPKSTPRSKGVLNIPVSDILPLSTGSNMWLQVRDTALIQNHPFGTLNTPVAANENNVAHNLVTT